MRRLTSFSAPAAMAFWSALHAFPAGFDPFFGEIQEVYDAIGERQRASGHRLHRTRFRTIERRSRVVAYSKTLTSGATSGRRRPKRRSTWRSSTLSRVTSPWMPRNESICIERFDGGSSGVPMVECAVTGTRSSTVRGRKRRARLRGFRGTVVDRGGRIRTGDLRVPNAAL
jgi:hypothetical protein